MSRRVGDDAIELGERLLRDKDRKKPAQNDPWSDESLRGIPT